MDNIYINFLSYKFKQYNIKNVLIVDDVLSIDEIICLSNIKYVVINIENVFLRKIYSVKLKDRKNVIINSFNFSELRNQFFDAIICRNLSEERIKEFPKVDFYFSRNLLIDFKFEGFVKDTELLIVRNSYLNISNEFSENDEENIKETVGFAITTTSSRFRIVKHQLNYLNDILKDLKYNTVISVFCDEELSDYTKEEFEELAEEYENVIFRSEFLRSVAKAKNKSIQPLIDKGCDFYFCLDDDAIIVDRKAVEYYIEACRDFHFLHLHLTGYLKNEETKAVLVKSFDRFNVVSYNYDNGCFIVFDKLVLDECGKWDERFDGWGEEHKEFGSRVERILLNDQVHHLAIPEVYEKEYVIALDAHYIVNLKEYENFRNLTSLMINSKISYNRNETNNQNISLKNNIKLDTVQKTEDAEDPEINHNFIDLVIPYVDNTDQNWIKLFNKSLSKISPERQKQYHLNSVEENSRRFSYNSLFKYLFRSVEKYANFINNIFLIVQSESQIPEWINRKTVKIVYHKDFIPKQFLPTFNANTIESFLHNIPGLGEHFLYGNDDLLFNNYLKDTDFFDDGNPKNGFYKKFDLKSLTPYIDILKNNREGYYYCFKNSYILSYNLFKDKVSRKENERICKYHSFTSFKKSNYEFYFNQIKDYIMKSTTPFRNPTNINQYYFALCFGFETDFKYLLNVNSEYEFLKMFNLQNIDAQVNCINCLYSKDLTPTICLNNFQNNNELISKLLDDKFKDKSKYEI